MKLIGGDPLNIQCEDKETITVAVTDGTVEKIATDLDGVPGTLDKGDGLSIKVQPGKRRILVMTYPFKANEGESFETKATGDQGGDVSIDKYKQKVGEASKARMYTFNA